MSPKHILPLLVALFAFTTSCNKESYIEGVGSPASTLPDPNKTTGTITIYCTNDKLDGCGSLSIYIDGDYEGTIDDKATSDPSCGTNGSKAVTIELEQGSHNFSISSTTSNCLRYTFTRSITKNQCLLQGLQ